MKRKSWVGLAITLIIPVFLQSTALAQSIYTLDIHANSSEVSYIPNYVYLDGRPVLQEFFQISGMFTLTVDNTSYLQPVVSFDPINITTSRLPHGQFNLPTYPIGYDGLNFSGNGNPCNFFNSPGTCWSMGNFGYATGSFDGTDLEMTGKAPFDFFESYLFSIHASVIEDFEAPEPTTMLLFGTGIAGLAGTRLKRKKK